LRLSQWLAALWPTLSSPLQQKFDTEADRPHRSTEAIQRRMKEMQVTELLSGDRVILHCPQFSHRGRTNLPRDLIASSTKAVSGWRYSKSRQNSRVCFSFTPMVIFGTMSIAS
jgi:hypothetical protein